MMEKAAERGQRIHNASSRTPNHVTSWLEGLTSEKDAQGRYLHHIQQFQIISDPRDSTWLSTIVLCLHLSDDEEGQG
jgi:hypothetical protein